ncbi:MAG: PadR family transcriptional regulator [Cyanobacteria bacterium P01_D01_bin.6]
MNDKAFSLALEVRNKPACEYILHTLWKKPRYGLEISQIISQSTAYNMNISSGSIYPHLKFLEKQKMVKLFKFEEDYEKRKNHRRKYYELTEVGKDVLVTLDEIKFKLTTIEPDMVPVMSF